MGKWSLDSGCAIKNLKVLIGMACVCVRSCVRACDMHLN